MLDKTRKEAIIRLTEGHEESYLVLKAAEELNELAVELLQWVQYNNTVPQKNKRPVNLSEEVVDVSLVLTAMCDRIGLVTREVPPAVRAEIEEEIRKGGIWGLSAGIMESASQMVVLSKKLIQSETKRHGDQERRDLVADFVMDVACHLHKLRLVFFIFPDWFNAKADEKLQRVSERNAEIPGFGTLRRPAMENYGGPEE